MKKQILTFFMAFAAASSAFAHVKWFSTMANCVDTPLAPLAIFSNISFLVLGLASTLAMLLVFHIDAKISAQVSISGRSILASLQIPMKWHPTIVRLGVAGYFGIVPFYFSTSPIILTPELKAPVTWLPYFQLGVAMLSISRRTAFAAALGILGLYIYAAALYGWFHLLDYVFYLGIAAYLAIDARPRRENLATGLALLRITMGASLLWVSVEKWSYPSWTHEILLSQLRGLLIMGLKPEFFITAAGFVEFCLAFVLIVGRFSAQVAAGVLAALMIVAMPAVGPIDAIGHLPLVMVLVLLAGTKNAVSLPRYEENPNLPRGLAILFAASVPGITSAYYCAHEFAYHGKGRTDWLAISALVALMSLLFAVAVATYKAKAQRLRLRGRVHVELQVRDTSQRKRQKSR